MNDICNILHLLNENDHLFTPFSYFLSIYLLNLADEGGV